MLPVSKNLKHIFSPSQLQNIECANEKLPVDYHYRNLDIDCIVDSCYQYVHQRDKDFDLFAPDLELDNFDKDQQDFDASGLVVVDTEDFPGGKRIAGNMFQIKTNFALAKYKETQDF